MMLLIGESSMSNAHLVNGAVVNVRARVRLNPSFIILGYDKVISDIDCFHYNDEKSDRSSIPPGRQTGSVACRC